MRERKSEFDRMWDMAFASFGRKLADAERALVHDSVEISKAVVEGRIRVEVVA